MRRVRSGWACVVAIFWGALWLFGGVALVLIGRLLAAGWL